jgi:hypothetical protein
MKLISTRHRKPWNSTAKLGFDLIENLCKEKSTKFKNIDEIVDHLKTELEAYTAQQKNRGKVSVEKWFYTKGNTTTFICGLNRPNSTESCAITIKYHAKASRS